MSEPTQSHRDAAAALAALLDEFPDGVPGLPAVVVDDSVDEVVDAEIVEEVPRPVGLVSLDRQPGVGVPVQLPVEPSGKELVLRGRAALVDARHNPDDWADEETEAELRAAIPEKTLQGMEWALGAARWYCQERPGFPVREFMPMTVATVRQWIKDHWYMTKADGSLRGRRGQPYSPRTVQTRIYLMAKIWKLKGYTSPIGHPKVQLQLRRYKRKYEAAGFTPDQAYALSPDESVQLGRVCQDFTVGGIRNRAAFRLQYDTGMRVGELLALRIEDVSWSLPEWAGPGYDGPMNATIRIRKSKTDQDAAGREVGVQYMPYLEDDDEQFVLGGDKKPVPHPDADMDPAALLWQWVRVLRERGRTRGLLWVECTPTGTRRKDGTLAGKLIDLAWEYVSYESCLVYFARKAGIDVDPVTGEKRRITSHMNRAGHITASLDAGEPIEKIALRTGHSPTGSIHGYYRARRRFGTANTGAQIRRRQGAAHRAT